MIGGIVLDTTAILDIVTGSTIYGQALVSTAAERGLVLLIPAAALYQAWALVPDGAAPLLELLLDLPVVVVDPLGQSTARDAAQRARHTPGAEYRTAEAHVVHAARARGWRVLTRAPERLWEIDSHLVVETPPAD